MDEYVVAFAGGMKVDVSHLGRLIRTDQPATHGGDGSAPSPFELFLASIAACAGFYFLAFCRERGIPLEGAGVVMRTERDPDSKMIGRIEIELSFPAGFPEKYKPAVLKAVDFCAVKAHILRPPRFEITVRPA